MPSLLARHRFEASVALAIVLFSVVLVFAAPTFFGAGNLVDLLLANLPVLVIALGATFVLLTGEIDISVGSVFAICGVVAGTLATWGVPIPVAVCAAPLVGAALGGLNGALVAYLRLPSIVVTLATLVMLRDGLRWITQGAWVQNLPDGFQWLGLSQRAYPLLAGAVVAALCAAVAWGLRFLSAGRRVYAVGSNAEAARLIGIDVAATKLWVFALAGGLTGLAALLNAVRFNQIPSNAGLGLEMKVVAAVVVGGAAITGGRGTILGTILGVALLAMIGPALTFLGVSAYWERALQGGILLAAVAATAVRSRQRASRPSTESSHAVVA